MARRRTDLLDEVTTAITRGDLDRAARRYAIDAMVTPDAGEVKGRTAIVEYFRTFVDAFADLRWEPIAYWDSGDVAIDEGYFGGTHTADVDVLRPG